MSIQINSDEFIMPIICVHTYKMFKIDICHLAIFKILNHVKVEL